MAKCMSCGKTVLLTTIFGNVVLCKNCGSLINVQMWNDRNFSSMDELLYYKNDALQRAVNCNMSQGMCMEITRFFDEYINRGFIATIDGKVGQTLKLFSNFCVVTTKSEGKKTDLEYSFREFDNGVDDEGDEEFITANDKKDLVKGLMSGRLVQTGIGVALSAKINQEEKEKRAQKIARERQRKVERLISVGERIIDLRRMISVEMFSSKSVSNGYLKFVPKNKKESDIYECEYFFFNNKKVKQNVEWAKNVINSIFVNIEKELHIATNHVEQVKSTSQVTQLSEQPNATDVFENVRKFKQLLDEGIISEEEFNIKKKELLGL